MTDTVSDQHLKENIMGFSFRRSIGLGNGSRVNISKRGASVSQHLGPVTVNSRGRISIRLGKGLSWRGKL